MLWLMVRRAAAPPAVADRLPTANMFLGPIFELARTKLQPAGRRPAACIYSRRRRQCERGVKSTAGRERYPLGTHTGITAIPGGPTWGITGPQIGPTWGITLHLGHHPLQL